MSIKKQRISNFELLRIISILLIIMAHYITHGALDISAQPLSLHKILALVISSGGGAGVSCFVLISAYFTVGSTFKLNRLVALLSKTWFYSVGFLILFLFFLTPVSPIGITQIIQSLAPTTYDQWWFISTYAILYIISPFLNILIKNISRQQHKGLILTFVFVWYIGNTFLSNAPASSQLGWFVLLYLCAAYFRLYPLKQNLKAHVLLSIFWALIIVSSVVAITVLGERIPLFRGHERMFRSFDKLPGFMLSLELFLVFLQAKPLYSKPVNTIAASTLGVYLMHENVLFRPYLWKTLFNNTTWYNTNMFFVHYALVVLIIFTGASIIDFVVWESAVGKLSNRLLDKYLTRFTAFLTRLWSAIEKRFSILF